jgi:hypothetical protein
MCLRFVFLLITRVAAWLRLSRREDAWKTAEILVLRHQLTVLQRRRPCHPRLNWADRALLAVWVPKTRVTWADPLRERGWFGQALSVGPAGLGSAGDGMIFGLWA